MNATTDAKRALTAPRFAIAEAETPVPRRAGLYAIYGDGNAWKSLGLGEQPDDRPLYVGKSESSLLGRDIRQHFGDGRTGSSTLRRSFAALLRTQLRLKAIPRNPNKPERFANYGLLPQHDKLVTEWMRANLQLAFWLHSGAEPLAQIESSVISSMLPPLNLAGVTTQWSSHVSAARKVMAEEARAWATERGFGV
jgi:hypothetical protein